MVLAAEGVNKIPGTYKRENIVALDDNSGTVNRVSGYVIEDPFGESLNLLALANSEGKHEFYVFKATSGGYTLTRYEDYESEKGTEAPTTEAPTETTAPPKESGILTNGAIWLMILGGVFVVILTAGLIVFFMSRKQQREEDELDLGEEGTVDDLSDEDMDEFGHFPENEETEEVPFDISSYRNPTANEKETEENAFDVNFEDAFPDEVRTAAASGAGAGEEVSQAFDFTFDFGKAKNEEEQENRTEEVTYVDLSKEETPKTPKKELSGEEFEELHYGPKEPEGTDPEGK